MLRTTLIATIALCLVACVSPNRNTSALAESVGAVDAINGSDDAATCNVSGLTAERGGFELLPLILEGAPARVISVDHGHINVKLVESRLEQVFSWPTRATENLFQIGESVRITRTTRWDSVTETTIDVHEIVGDQVQAVFVSARRTFVDGAMPDKLSVETPVGIIRAGAIECERAFDDGCTSESEVRFAGTLDDGSTIAAGAPLSRDEVVLDWARGSRIETAAGCGESDHFSVIEEALEVAYFEAAVPRLTAPDLADQPLF